MANVHRTAAAMYFPPAPFSLDTARLCTALTESAYDMYQQWVAQRKPAQAKFDWTPKAVASGFEYSQPLWGVDKVLWFKHPEPFAFLARAGNDAYLAFRGTVSHDDWIEDADTGHRPFRLVAGYGSVQHGFLTVYTSMSADVNPVLAEGSAIDTLYITGHSLGSALSTLCVPDVLDKAASGGRIKTVRHYNLASPRVGDPAFASAYNVNGAATYRIVNTADVVPNVPPSLLGHKHYAHVGTVVDFTAQYGSAGGNHSIHDAYAYALDHPEQPWAAG